MDEKVLIKSERYGAKAIFKPYIITGATLSLFSILFFWNWHFASWIRRFGLVVGIVRCIERDSGDISLIMMIIPFIFSILVGAFMYLWLRSYELTVTDKRIYGKVAWGKRVDLPLDSISATATLKFSKGISVSTASGRISFLVIKNAEEIYNVISNLLINRQQEKNVVIEKAPAIDNADQLKKYKDLLDSGVITQEEFDTKKKQLLGL